MYFLFSAASHVAFKAGETGVDIERVKSLKFKYFEWVTEGFLKGLDFRRRGELDERCLQLGKEQIPLEDLMGVTRRGKLLTLEVAGRIEPLDLVIRGGKERQLQRSLARFRSSGQVHRSREAFKRAGRRELHRTELCPACAATIDVSGLPRAPKLYCPYCDTVSRLDGVADEEASFHRCDLCDHYGPLRDFMDGLDSPGGPLGHPRNWQRPYRACTTCSRVCSRRMLVDNLPYLIGVPRALWQLVKATRPDRGLNDHRGLAAANLAAASGELEQAATLYDRIVARAPDSVAARYNRACLRLGWDVNGAVADLCAALRQCPSHEGAAQVLVELGRCGHLPGIYLPPAA